MRSTPGVVAPVAGRAKKTSARTRILESVISWAAETGLRKLSMDEVARRAHVGRATLYKHFPRREALIDAVVKTELENFFAEVQTTVEKYEDPEERLIHGFARAYRLLRDHPAVSPILTLNPELFVPYVIAKDSYALNLGRTFVMSFTPGDELPPEQRERFAEHVARAFHTLILIPSSVLGLNDPDGPENYARDFLIPVRNHLRDSGK
ncbi:TetR/AcrR family transcriptional regulator [Mycobacterium syngnathidarum]